MDEENSSASESSKPSTPDSTLQEAELEDQKRLRDLLALSRISAAVSSLRDLDAILGVALDNVLNIMNGNIGGILLIDEQTQTLSYQVHHGLSAEHSKLRLRVGEGIAGRVAQSGKAILLEDISADQRVARPDIVRTEGLRAFISVPVRAKETVLGVINVASHMPRQFTKDDMYLLHSIGDQLGVAIEQTKLYERLRKGRERYRRLARHILVAQEEERKRIARELHDETSQSLAGLALNLQALVDMAEMSYNLDDEFKARLKKVHSLAIQISIDVSRLINELRPSLLDTLGFVPAIRQYAEANLRPLGINVSVDIKSTPTSSPPEVEAGLFRIAQGAIANIARHSQAKNATISLQCDADELLLRIVDDGKGFAVSELTGIDDSGRGRGLFTMKERVRLLGGSCLVESQPERGTMVTVRIPIIRSSDNAQD